MYHRVSHSEILQTEHSVHVRIYFVDYDKPELYWNIQFLPRTKHHFSFYKIQSLNALLGNLVVSLYKIYK